MTNPKTIVARFLTAGGEDFFVFEDGADARRAFDAAQQQAQYESGHGGYSGTIAEKGGYEIRSKEPMSMRDARAFANRDIDNNDKWGPAFAIPIADAVKESPKSKTVTIKVEARQEYEVRGNAETALREKFKGPGLSVDVSIKKVTPLKSGKMPKMKVAPADRTSFTWLNGPQSFPTKADAVKALGEHILKRKPGVGEQFIIQQIKHLTIYTVEDTAKSLDTFEVEAVVTTAKVKQTGKIKGWLFYGIASS